MSKTAKRILMIIAVIVILAIAAFSGSMAQGFKPSILSRSLRIIPTATTCTEWM